MTLEPGVNKTVMIDRAIDVPNPNQHACLDAAADKDHMTTEDPLGSDDEDKGSEDEDDSQGDMDSGSEEGEDSDEEEGDRLLKATLEARQAARAAGDHPLQQSFRAAAAQLLEKYATGADKKKKRKEQNRLSASNRSVSPGPEDEEAVDAEAEEEQEQASEDDSTAASGQTSSEEEGEDQEEEAEQDTSSDAASSEVSEQQEQQPGEPHLDGTQRTDRQQTHAEAQTSDQAHAAAVHAGPSQADVDDIPFTIAAPSSYAAFAQLAKGQGPSRLGLIIQRIRACNAIALATDNRRKLQASPAMFLKQFL